MEQAQAQIQEIIKDLVRTSASEDLDSLSPVVFTKCVCAQLVRMDYTEVIIDQRFHRHLIGKNGANSESTEVAAIP